MWWEEEFRDVEAEEEEQRESPFDFEFLSLLSKPKVLPMKFSDFVHDHTTDVDYYKILEVDFDATEDVIRSNYIRLALKWHPDKKKEESATSRFQEINEAYKVLSDPIKRRQYDEKGVCVIQDYNAIEYLNRYKGLILTCNGLDWGFFYSTKSAQDSLVALGGHGKKCVKFLRPLRSVLLASVLLLFHALMILELSPHCACRQDPHLNEDLLPKGKLASLLPPSSYVSMSQKAMAPNDDCAFSTLLCVEDSSCILGFDNEDDADDQEEHDLNRFYVRKRCDIYGDLRMGFPSQADECLVSLVRRETDHMPRDDYAVRLRSGALDLSIRRDAIGWILKVHGHYKFGPLSAYLSVNYLDRFFSNYELPKGKAWLTQLLSVACLSLAAKMEETEVPLSMDLQERETKYAFEAKTIQRMELLVLSTLKWRMQAVTPFSYVEFFLHRFSGGNAPTKVEVFRSVELILSTITGTEFLAFRPSEIAAAITLMVLGETQDVGIEKAVSCCIQVAKEKVLRCYEVIKDMELMRERPPRNDHMSLSSVPQSPIERKAEFSRFNGARNGSGSKRIFRCLAVRSAMGSLAEADEGINHPRRRPRFLCLHGFRTSGAIMRTQVVGKWPEEVTARLDLVFPDAPFPAEGKSDVEGIFSPPYYEWFQFDKDFMKYTNLDECFAYIEDLMIQHGPFDGLMGFSQGAILSAALVGLQARGFALTRVPKVKYLIIIGGAKFQSQAVAERAYAAPIDCTSLHFLGDMDFLRKHGEALLESFVKPYVIRHPKGHTVPRLEANGSFSPMPMANPLYGAGPSRSREGLISRNAAPSDEIQLRIDPMHADLDEEIDGLHRKIRQLKGVAQEIETEAKFQNDFITQLQMTLIKAQAGVKNNMRRLNKSIIQKEDDERDGGRVCCWTNLVYVFFVKVLSSTLTWVLDSERRALRHCNITVKDKGSLVLKWHMQNISDCL
ncbi:Bet1-like protein [Musa troglodytarum]|uniref:Bet1-like protein n=1 Tax=Musa troglodytarum TaxID=320322 RepID=A0A9E7IIQ9_9LILI|nr:Bet1-like protein [Musa troglodytarum]